MWTEVGKLMLLHLILVEIPSAKGKTLWACRFGHRSPVTNDLSLIVVRVFVKCCANVTRTRIATSVHAGKAIAVGDRGTLRGRTDRTNQHVS